MSQSDWPEEGRRSDHPDRAGQRPPDDWGDQAQRPPSGMSGGMKACLVVLCVVGFCCLLCCGVFGFMVYSMVPKISTAPADIDAARDDIAKINLPAGFEPKSSAKFDNFIFSMLMVEYSNPGHATLMMMQMRTKFAGANDAQLPMRQQFEQRRVTEFGPMTNAKIETKTIKIKGRDCTCTFTQYEEAGGGPGKKADTKSDKKASKKTERRRIQGDFDGKNGLVLFEIDFDDTYKEADIVKMLENIQ
jgi:hypothetical protein